MEDNYGTTVISSWSSSHCHCW